MAKYEPPVTTPGPRGGALLPPAPGGRPKPPPPPKPGGTLKPVTSTIAAPEAIETKARKKKADEELTLSDVSSAAKETLPVMGQMALAAPAAMGGLLVGLTQPMDRKGKPWYEQALSYIPIVGSKTGQTLATGVFNTLRGQNAKLAYESLKRGETPLPYVLEDVGNIAILAAGAGATLKGVSAGSKSASVSAAAEAGAKQAFRLARTADVISDAPITLPAGLIGKGVNVSGRFGRWNANRLRSQAAVAEAADPINPEVSDLRRRADKLDSYFGKEVFVDGVARTLTNKALRKMNNRVLRAASTADDAVRQAMLGIQDRPLYRDDINPATGEAYGPLTPVENQAVIAILNGRARLINELMPRLNRTAAEIAQMGRYRYAPGAGLTPEGAQLAVDFLNRNVDDVTGQRLADAAERLSRELESTTQLAREGYGRRRALEPMYDIPVPEPVRLSARLRQEGAIDQADALDELAAQGFFDELLAGRFETPAAQDALMHLQLVLEQAPDNVALDPAVYPPKERNNVAFYGRIREAMKAQAAATAGGAPPGPGYPGGRPTPMDEGPTTGLQPEEFYDSINAPGAFSRMPERYLRNSIKQLERLRGRSRQIGEKIVQIEMSIRNLEFKIIKASLRIEALEGYYTDANGNRILPGEDGTYPAGATYVPGLIEKLKEKRAAAAAELERMRAEQAQTTVIDGKVHTVEQVEQIVAEADNAVTAVEASIAELEAEIDDTTTQIDEMEGAQADAANALEDLGEDPTPILEAAAADVESIPGDPEAFLETDDGTAALDSARADVEAARTAQAAARNVELEARAKITDLEARYRNEQDDYAKAVAKQEQKAVAGAEAPSREQVLEVLNRLADQGAIPTKVVKSVEKAYDTTFVEPKPGASVKAVDKAVFSAKDGGLGGQFRGAIVNIVDGNLWYTDSYMAVIVDPASKFGQKLAEAGNQPGVYRTTAAGRSAADMQRARMSGGSEAPNIQAVVDRARPDVALPPATVIGVDLPADGAVVVLQNADGTTAGVALNNLNKVYEAGDTLHFSDPAKPITVVRNGQIVGIVMPIRGDYTPITPDAVYQKLREGQFGSIGPAAAELDAIQLASATRPRLKQPKKPTITPDDLDAATAEWNDAQEAVRVADQALREAEGQLYAVEQAAPATRLAPPEDTTAARRQKHDEDRRRLGELEVAAEAAMAKREDAFAAAAQAKRNNDPNQAALAAAFNEAKAEFDAIDAERSALNGELWLRESREPWLRSNGGPDDPTRAIRPGEPDTTPSARLTPPGKFSKAEVSKRLRAVAQGLDPRLTWQIGYRTADGTDLGTFSKLDPGSIQDAILPHGTVVDLYGYSRGRNAELITVERVDLGDATKPAAAIKEQKPQRVVDPVVAATRAVTEATETLAAMEEYALEAYQGLEAAKAEAGDVQAATENYDAIVADVQKAQARLDEAQRKLDELRQETPAEPRLAPPPPPEIISTSAATEADWQKQSDGTYTINTGSRRYAALKVDVTPPGAKKPRTTWALKRYGSDGEIIEGATQVFPNFKAARDYVQQQMDADGLDTGDRYVYRPGRELGPGPGVEVPVSLLAAEQRLQRAEAAVGSAEQRLQNLRTQIEKNTARIDKLRIDEAAQRAKLAPMTAAAVRTEARLAPEIFTQPEVTQFAGQPRGVPMVGRALTPEGVPVMAGEGLPAMLRPTQATRRIVDDQIREVNAAEAERGVPVEQRTREVEMVEKAVNEALLRRRESLPPALPVRVALAAPREIGDQFIGSQYVPVGRQIQRASGPRQTIEQGLTGDVVLRSEKRRSGMGDEIYDILELGRVIASERRQMELNEGFRMLMNSQFALSPEEILGRDAVRDIEQQAYDAAVNEWGAYAPGVPNRDVVFEQSRREIMGQLLYDEMKRRGFETLPIEGYIGGRVELGDIDGSTKFLPVYARDKVMQRVVPAVPPAVGLYLRGTARVTGAFKNLTLPLSVVWQLGDLIGIFWSAAVTGVNPITMADYMVQMLRENYGGPTATRMDILRNIFKDPENRRVGELGELLSASGLQDTGLRIQETRRFRGEAAGAEPQTVPQRLLGRVGPEGSQLRRGAELAGAAFPTFRKGAYRVNEAINRVGRHAYFLAKFGDELRKYNEANGTNLTVEEVGAMGLHQRPGPLRTAWEDVVDTANEVMGDWLDLTPRERKYVLPHLTFWAWTKHIHKMFVRVAKDNPAAIKWQLYLGALAYDPDSDPLELYSSLIPTPGGGLAGTNFLNPFGDIVEGPLGTAVIKQDPRKLFSGLSPLPRILYAGATGQNIARGREVTRQYGTGAVSETGTPFSPMLFQRPGELLGFSLQQFPLGTKLLDLMPSGQLPGTSIQTGPFERYDTGQARFKPMTSKPVPKFGGRLLTAARLLTLPGVPSMSIEKMRDIERRAQQRLRAFETAKKTAEARND